MKYTHKHQHFALDINNNIVDIRNTSFVEEQNFFCPYCHKEMITKRGNIRQWHFAHKTDKCSYDKYLHTIAELMIKDWFYKKESIMLHMNTLCKCKDYDSCIFFDKEACIKPDKGKFNLKKYYSKCIQEHRYGEFVPDLYCESEKYPKSPIFIEILVTHECSQEKKDSGIRIIELKIQSEDDILKIVNSSCLIEGENVRLYNFIRKDNFADDYAQSFQKYILHSTLRSYVDREFYTCRNYNHHRKGIYEISIPYDDCSLYFINSGGFYKVGKAKAYIDGYLKKDCQLCKWHSTDMMGLSFCILYKKCGNPKYCDENDSQKCSMFRVDMNVINNAISEFEEYLETGKADVWKIDNQNNR